MLPPLCTEQERLATDLSHRGLRPSERAAEAYCLGPLVATAIVATIGNGAAFHKGREFSSWLGLVPRRHDRASRINTNAPITAIRIAVSVLTESYRPPLLFESAGIFFDRTARSRTSSLAIFLSAVLVQQLEADDMHCMAGLRIALSLLQFPVISRVFGKQWTGSVVTRSMQIVDETIRNGDLRKGEPVL